MKKPKIAKIVKKSTTTKLPSFGPGVYVSGSPTIVSDGDGRLWVIDPMVGAVRPVKIWPK